jgi:hypothetical protein
MPPTQHIASKQLADDPLRLDCGDSDARPVLVLASDLHVLISCGDWSAEGEFPALPALRRQGRSVGDPASRGSDDMAVGFQQLISRLATSRNGRKFEF